MVVQTRRQIARLTFQRPSERGRLKALVDLEEVATLERAEDLEDLRGIIRIRDQARAGLESAQEIDTRGGGGGGGGCGFGHGPFLTIL